MYVVIFLWKWQDLRQSNLLCPLHTVTVLGRISLLVRTFQPDHQYISKWYVPLRRQWLLVSIREDTTLSFSQMTGLAGQFWLLKRALRFERINQCFFFFSDMASSDSMVKLSLKREIAQLMREKDIKRARMSEVCADLVYHCKRHASEDYLLSCAKGSARKPAGNDPYKEGSSCKVM